MGLSSRLLRLPRPQKFLYVMSLSTGASLITLSLLLNKLSGLYGILALFTGFHLSVLQLSMYIYSIVAFGITLYLAPHIRTQSPLYCLALAWFYVADSLINAAYTAAFAVTWFLLMAQHNAGNSPPSDHVNAPGAAMIDDTAGFTSPKHNVSHVEVIDGQNAVAYTTPSSSTAGVGPAGVLSPDSMNSIGLIIALWTIRLYFCVVMLAYARVTLRQHVARTAHPSTAPTDYTSASTSSSLASDPFSVTRPEGQGWRGKLGRVMVSMGRTYWLGADEDDSWMNTMGGKFRRSGEEGVALNKIESGPAERERRRRSGTGPPEPPPSLQQSAPGQLDGKSSQQLAVPAHNL